MPKLVKMVPETEDSFTRPVILEVMRHLYEITGLTKTTDILFPGDTAASSAQIGSTMDTKGETLRTSTTERWEVEVDEQMPPEFMLSMAVLRPEHSFIFADDALEVAVKPAYAPTEYTLSFRYRAPNKNKAERWRDDIRNRVAQGRDTFVKALSYHYSMPDEFEVILREIHRLRENVDGYGEDYDTWFKKYRTMRYTTIKDHANKNGLDVIAETQNEVLGWFDFESAPERGGRDDEFDTWFISFSYKFKIEKPVACVLYYPLMIHNQVIQYVDKQGPDDLNKHQRRYSLSGRQLNYFDMTQEVGLGPKVPGHAVPYYDEFVPNRSNIVQPTLRIVTCLFALDLSEGGDRRSLMSLQQLGDGYKLTPVINRFMRGEAPFMLYPMKSVFNVSIYKGGYLMAPERFEIDSELQIRSKEDLSPRSYYHMRLSVVTNLAYLDQDAKDRLKENGDALQEIVCALDPKLCGTVPINKDNYVRTPDWEKIVDAINKNTLQQLTRRFRTVQFLSIDAISPR